MSKMQSNPSQPDLMRYALIAGAVVVAFFAAYGYALGSSASRATGYAGGVQVPAGYAGQTTAGGPNALAGGGGCCGGGNTAGTGCCAGRGRAAKASTAAKIVGGEQVVDMTVNGGYNPDHITAKAGLPLRVRINHPGPAGGCDGTLVFPDFGISRRLPASGRDEIVLNPLRAGTYRFTCGMNMLTGTLVVH